MAGFRFKQFAIAHDRCAMKVGTDSIVLGSVIPALSFSRALDIGTGSGLLAIMLAQKSASDASITGIDIDEDAVLQARQNAQASPWPDKLSFICRDINGWQGDTGFDLIVSNPPYYVAKQGELHCEDANYLAPQRRLARHMLSLNHQQLLLSVVNNLRQQGQFFCILPTSPAQGRADSAHFFTELALQHGLRCHYQLDLRATPNKPVSRSVFGFGHCGTQRQHQLITIRDIDNQYSAEYRQLCSDFYLHF